MDYELAAEYLLLDEDDENLVRGHQVNAVKRGFLRNRMLAAFLLSAALPAHAIPPPPAQPPLLREARMTVTVQLIEAHNGTTTKITELCTVSGKIPVFSDDGRAATFHARDIPGCSMLRNGKKLQVSVQGAKALSKNFVTFATAYVGVTPPDAVPLCPDLCGPQALADSRAEIRVSGNPRSIQFSVHPNPISLLNAKPTVWLEADIKIVK